MNKSNYVHEHIFGIMLPGNVFSISIRPLPVLCPCSAKKAENGTLTRQTLGVTDLNLCMHTQLDCGNNTGCVPPGHTFSLVYKG